ncbi:hypothetical protein SAMN05444920_101962 [Nonomuraea solani]|uniref:Outer membrane channel protein CpnT-like N-terminal domain-containing protein n=1 Tax=Nonomuraea solani TaxID=1144553 RepID=A0A1H5VSJ8_9ACTN|nr:hypothetical protein [Nonomuraea solani]SEF89821.1 hypothetical protein SAMN05444920_101962 [Nonomuraea solani]
MTHTGGIEVQGQGGQSNGPELVRIDTDTQPVWETEVLPDWVERFVIPMLAAGQSWTGASESGLSQLAHAYAALADGAAKPTEPAGAAARTIVTGWAAPATANFVTRAKVLYGKEGGLAGVTGNARAYAQQASNFAVETQYTKLSINVAFWITVVAIAIAIIASFFSAGTSTALIGPYAAGARAAISRILVRLMTVAGRELGVTRLARVASLSGATGRGVLTRLLASPLGRELVEEIGEEFFIDAATQYQQIQMGTRKEWDWQKSAASIIGAGGGAVIGTRLAGPVSRVTRHVPGFTGRALSTGLTNTLASPVGSFIANGAVYGQWQSPFTTESMLGGFMGGVGRTGSISPFSPDVYTALANPVTTLASAYDAAARTDAANAGNGPSGGTAGGGTSPNGAPHPDDGQPSAPGATRTPDPATVPATRTTTGQGSGPAPGQGPGQNGRPGSAPDLDGSTQRRTSTTPDDASAPAPDEDPTADDAPQPDTAGTPAGGATVPVGGATAPAAGAHAPAGGATASAGGAAAQPDGAAAQPDGTAAQADGTAAQPGGTPEASGDSAPAQGDGAPDQGGNPSQAGGMAAAQLGDQQGQPDQNPAATSTAAVTPALRAKTALLDALSTNFPNAVIGPTGDLILPGPDGDRIVPAATMGRIRTALNARAGDLQNQADLQVEAASMLLVAQADDRLSAPAPDDAPRTPAPTTSPSPAPDTGRPERVPAATSKPGTVTSRPVRDTRYVPDARQGPDLTLDEAKDGTARLRPRHFTGEGVQDIAWSPTGDTLVVSTQSQGTQHFRPVVGGLDPSLMGMTELRAGTADDPHIVHLAPRAANDQLPRTWLHEITDTLQRLAATEEGSRQGVLRRVLPGNRPTRDDCVPARRNELAFLIEEWHQARSLPEKRHLAVDIDGVLRELAAHGDTPPLPPWAPSQGTRDTHAPPVLGEHPLAADVAGVIEQLKKAEAALQRQIDTKTKSAEEAGQAAKKAKNEARKAGKQRDSGKAERARKSRREATTHRSTQARHKRIAQSYAAALTEATNAREAYERALQAMNQSAGPVRPGEVGMAGIAARLAADAARQHQTYLDTLAKALPQEIALSAAMPTGRLAHLGALTGRVNALLERNGVAKQFTPDELERALRADFHKAVTADGVVLRAGEGKSAAEVRIKLDLSDLVEVIDPAVKASEMMVGNFFQAGRTVTAAEAGSAGVSMGFNTKVLAQFMPDGEWPRMVAELLGVGVGVSAGRNWSASGGAGTYAQGGSVSDNRSESLLFDAAATWTVEIRTGRDQAWRDATTVSAGLPGDTGAQRMWVSHSYTDEAPRKKAWIDPAKRDLKMPNHTLTGMTGLEEALATLTGRLGGDFARVGTNAHNDLRKFVTDELPTRLRQAVNGGFTRDLTVDGELRARVRVETEVVLVSSEMVGGPTNDEWEEEVLVDFAASPGGVSYGGSLEGNASAGFNHPGLEDVDVLGDMGDYAPNLGPRLRGARAASQSYSSTANGQAIHPSVHRKTRHTQGYRLELRHTFAVEEIGEPPVKLKPMTSTALVRMQESAAYRFGLPVDAAALVHHNGKILTDRDGNVVLRGDPRPVPIKGRKTELPDWLGDGPGQMRGSGPALVQEISGLDKATQDTMDELAKLGVIPKVVNGQPQYSSNDLARASQILNLQEIVTQLSEHRLRTAYDQLAQDGIFIDLVLHGLNAAPDHYTVHVQLTQDFSDRDDYVGVTDDESAVNLDIGTDTSGRGISRSRTYSGGPSGSESDGPDQGQDGLSHEVGVNAGGNQTRTAGSSVGSTVNMVTLAESTGPVAIFNVKHQLTVTLHHNGEVTELASEPGKAKLLFATDLLPPSDATPPTPVGKPKKSLLSRATLLHMDVRGAVDAARRVLPGAMNEDSPAFHHIAAFLNMRNLISHPEMLTNPLTTDVAVRPQGAMATRSSLSVSGEMDNAEVLGVVDHVNGRIVFGLGSAGVSWGGSTGVSAGASVGVSDLDDAGASNDGGKIGLPSRSGGTATSTSILDIWGTEELTIEFGRQYLLRADVNLTLTGSESAANAVPTGRGRIPLVPGETADTQGSALFTIPEYDALRLYADGELDLPLALVGDAVERFRNGSLTLDKMLAVPLVQAYVKALTQARAAGEAPKISEKHTPDSLIRALKQVAGLDATASQPRKGKATRRLNQVLSEAKELIKRARDVVVAPQYENGMGLSVVESFTMSDQGNEVNLLDAVLDAVNDTVPGAVDDTPNLRKEMSVDFAGDRGQIHIPDMWSPSGFEKDYTVQTGPQADQSEVVTVRVRMEPADGTDPRKATLLGHTSDSGIIVQRYRYTDLSHTEAYNGSYSAGLDYSAADDGSGRGTGVSTDRGRSYSGTTNQQGTRLQRIGLFNGLDRIQQDMTLVIEIERRPARTRTLPGAAAIRKAAARIRRGRRPAVHSKRYDASLVRRIPTGMTRPESEDPGPVTTVTDTRRVELHPGHFVETLSQDLGRPSLYEVVSAQLSKMLGASTVKERQAELFTRLKPSALITGFERMAGVDGDVVVRMSRPKFKDQGADVTVRARLSDLTVVGGPFDAEIGEVDRKADAQNVSVSRGHAVPVAGNANASNDALGINGGVRAGEQSSTGVTEHHGARRERSKFEHGKAYTIRLRVDYDLTFQHVARRRDGNVHPVGEPTHLPGASGGVVDVTLFAHQIEELLDRMTAGVSLGSTVPGLKTFQFVMDEARQPLVTTLRAAQVAARERGAVAVVPVYEPDGLRRYEVSPDGTVHSVTPDGGFAAAYSTLSPPVLDAAEESRLDLRDVFLNSQVPGTFDEQVTAALAAGNVQPAAPAAPAWPATGNPAAHAAHAPVPSSTATSAPSATPGSSGPSAPSATSPEIANTPFDAGARPEGEPDLTVAEILAQDVTAADFGGAVAHLRTAGPDRMVLQVPGLADQHVRVLAEDPGEGLTGRTELRAGTAQDPHVLRIGPRIDPAVVSSVLVHELSHVAQDRMAGARHGVVRASLSEQQTEGTDHCLTPRLNEHAHLARKWRGSTDPRQRARLAEAIDAIAADVQRRGHTPPPSPWGPAPTGAPGNRAPGSPVAAKIRELVSAMADAPATPKHRSLAAALGGVKPEATADELATELRAEAAKAGLAPGQPGAAARTVALARAGELQPEHVAALRGPAALPEMAAAKALERAAALLGARVRTHGPGLLDIEIPGHPPVPVEIRPPQSGPAAPELLTFQVDGRTTIGANERAAAALAAGAVARARGLPVVDLQAVAELHEAVRQVRTATSAQLPGRRGVLYDLAAALPQRLIPPALAAELDTLLDGCRPGDRHAYWERMRKLSNGTGLPRDDECRCPEGGPCLCGRRVGAGTVPA